VTLKIYDILGQEVRTLANEKQAPGIKSLVWDGRDDTGKAVSSGIYIYRLRANDLVKNRKMLLIR
jgi:flagellar hook assembly protein FlgD